MERNDGNASGPWVARKISTLSQNEDWLPNTDRALAHLREKRAKSGRGRVWMWGAAAAAIACICLLAFPTSRDFVQQLWPRASGHEIVYVGQVLADFKALKYGQLAPEFALRDANGHEVQLADYRGKIVLLNFWATTCGGCRVEVPWLVGFEKQYKSRGFEVIGVSLDDDGWKVIRPFANEQKMNYAVLLGTEEITRRYGVSAMPMTILIDREGKVSAASVGLINKDECESEIVKLLDR